MAGEHCTSKVSRSGTPRNNRAIGVTSREAGKAFEDALDVELLQLQQRGYIAHWQPNNPGWRRAGARWLPVEASGADRSGTLRGGISFAMEVKSTGLRPDGKRASFQRSRISMKQEAHLELCARAPAPALLALEFRLETENVWCLVPWLEVQWAGRKSFHLDGWLLGYVVARDAFAGAFIARCGAALDRRR